MKSKCYEVALPDFNVWKNMVKCQDACPVNTDSGRYVQLIAERKFKEAYLVARGPNPLASICGRVCAAPCEDNCRRTDLDEPVSIRALKRFVCERYGPESIQPDTQNELNSFLELPDNQHYWHSPEKIKQTDKKKKVAIVGAGPAGLSCAYYLALGGFQVTVFDANPDPGGMLRYGIPEYRLPRSIIDQEVRKITELGVEIKTNTKLTAEYNIENLKQDGFEAFFISVGVQKGRDLSIPGSELDGVVKAVDYLLNVNRGYRMELGETVTVVGGGFVAFDVARTLIRDSAELSQDDSMLAAMDAARIARRSGVNNVEIVSLESIDEMPVMLTTQGREEYEEAITEGISFRTSWGPNRIIGKEGRVDEIELKSVVRVFDEKGQFNPKYDETRIESLQTDSVILAIGQQAELDFLTASSDVKLNPNTTIAVNPDSMETSIPWIFAGGDVAFGPRILIDAVRDGRKAAFGIQRYLSNIEKKHTWNVEISKISTSRYGMPDNYEIIKRNSPPKLSMERRTGVSEVEECYSEQDAVTQADRCLKCHVNTIYDPEKCILCNRCVEICPENCLKIIPVTKAAFGDESIHAIEELHSIILDKDHFAMIKDDYICIRCGLCATRCPTDAMSMELFRFSSADQ